MEDTELKIGPEAAIERIKERRDRNARESKNALLRLEDLLKQLEILKPLLQSPDIDTVLRASGQILELNKVVNEIEVMINIRVNGRQSQLGRIKTAQKAKESPKAEPKVRPSMFRPA